MEVGRRADNPWLGCGPRGSLRSLAFMNSLDLSPIPSTWPKLCQDLSVVLNCNAKKKIKNGYKVMERCQESPRRGNPRQNLPVPELMGCF